MKLQARGLSCENLASVFYSVIYLNPTGNPPVINLLSANRCLGGRNSGSSLDLQDCN